jgi:hypothetical protein
MAERKPAKKDTQQSAKTTTATDQKFEGLSDVERAAMKERTKELKAEARRGPRAGKADGERDVLAKIAEMPEPDRAMAERLHAIIKASAPALSPKTWYGMPAYAKDGTSRIEPAHVGCLVGPDGSRRIQKDRLDDHWDDQGHPTENRMLDQPQGVRSGLPRRHGGTGRQGLGHHDGSFTGEAKREGTRDGAPPIDLIDGDGLCELLKRYELGVKTTVRQVEEVAINEQLSNPVY